MVTLVIFTSVIGFYSLPLVSKYIYPQYHGTSMSLLLFNTTCILAISSAIPLHASLLGLVNPSFPPVYYSLSDNNFCRSTSDLCFHPSATISSSAILAPPPSDLQEIKQPSLISSSTQKDPSRESAYLLRRQVLLAEIPLDHQLASTLAPQVVHRTGSKLIALSYSAIFLLICYWFLHNRGQELVRIKDQVTSVWCMAVNWWLGNPSSATSSSANPVIMPSPT
ncbi:unnamed protein product [Rodentolepis nana]|uniref:Uncharacterized protein n=1 Tax=Rodentolepis nana TaxID=102285 RepID=A0A0R3U0C8_RODNA|nr:unnamed protein product [Rodentolepis nana]